MTQTPVTLAYNTPLKRETLTAHGIGPDWPMGIADRVRFHELDPLGHVNNTAHLTWFETFRFHYLAAYGLARGAATLGGVVLRHVEIDYRAALYLGDSYIVTGRTAAMRRTSFTMEYGVFCGDLKVMSKAVIVLVEADGHTKRALPQDLRENFIARDGAVAQ